VVWGPEPAAPKERDIELLRPLALLAAWKIDAWATMEELRRTKALYQQLVEDLEQNVIRKDDKGRYTFVNETFCKFVGKNRSEIIGQTDDELFPPEIARQLREGDDQVKHLREQVVKEETLDLGGRPRIIRSTRVPIFDQQHEPAG